MLDDVLGLLEAKTFLGGVPGYELACTGFDRHSRPLPKAQETLDEISHEVPPTSNLLELMPVSHADKQIGTLGGGNHFVEVLLTSTSIKNQFHKEQRSLFN